MIEWLYRNVRVPKDAVTEAIDGLDEDRDGYISLGEFIKAIKRLA